MTTTHTPFTLGSVSSGTLRTEDLLPAFAEAYRPFNPNAPVIEECDAVMQGWEGGLDYEDLDEVIGKLQECLTEVCPPFIYFGAHPGDGSDFGFFVDHNALEEARSYAVVAPCDCGDGHECAMQDWCASLDKEQAYLEEDNVIVQVNDHGNITVYDLDRNELWSVV
jgi:hypothetical protein